MTQTDENAKLSMITPTTNFSQLLATIDVLSKEEAQKAQEEASKYNIFQVINMTSNETSIHSAFLSDLLNPQGRHCQGSTFLERFIRRTCPDFNFDCSNATVEIEKYIGPKTETSGGRLDIILTDKNGKAIIIENKVYAGDQECQLTRYSNYANTRGNEYRLFYLTLDGHKASEESAKDLKANVDYFPISYKTNIVQWLDECLELTKGKELLYGGIKHYINLLKKLTNSETDTMMENSFAAEITNSSEHICNINNYTKAISTAKRNLIEAFWKALVGELSARGYYNLSLFQRENSKYTQIEVLYKEIEAMCSKFLFEEERKNKTYNYQIGVQSPIANIGDKQLMLGIIVDGVVSMRAYVVKGNAIVPFTEVPEKVKKMREASDLKANKWVKDSDIFICAKYLPQESAGWNFYQLPDETLNKLSDMKCFVKETVNQYIEYANVLKKLL